MKIDRHKRTAVLELEFLGRKTKVTVVLGSCEEGINI